MSAAPTLELEIDHVDIGYHGKTVVHNVTLGLRKGVIGCLLGPSGCGKTTLLRAIAGFEGLARGTIKLDGEAVSQPGRTLAPERRQVGMVFQDFALFPHLSVADNIAFGIQRWPQAKRRERVKELLALVGLPDYARRYPHALSGGQQQRIALARALAPRPRLLLLDEPFSSMDVELREGLAREVRAILKHEQITALLVTHDQIEAFAIADRIAVMHEGRILQWDNAYNLYHRPAARFVADFIGQGELLSGTVLNAHEVGTELGVITGHIPAGCGPGDAVDVLVRPDDIAPDPSSSILGEVSAKVFRGAAFLYTLQLPSGQPILLLARSHENYALGERIGIRPGFNHLVVFAADTARPEALSKAPEPVPIPTRCANE